MMRTAVGNLNWRSSQVKKRHFCSTFAFQMIPNAFQWEPLWIEHRMLIVQSSSHLS
jgi:hypothetical protein